MLNIKWNKLGVVTSLALALFAAGCGQEEANDSGNERNGATSVSEELEYTITGIEPGAGQSKTNDIAIAEYESLNGWEHEMSSAGAMLSALDEAIANKEPIIVSAWSPHYMFANWDIKYLEDPKGFLEKKKLSQPL